MYDRPSATELLEAARHHLETQIVPVAKATHHKLYFQTLVAINVMKIVQRELDQRSDHLQAEWARLNALLGEEPMPSTENGLSAQLAKRNRALCTAIRSGAMDDNPQLFEHLKATATEQLQVANPRFLATLATEDAS